MNKFIPIFGIIAVVVGGIFFFQYRKNSGQSLIPPLKKDIQIGTNVCGEFPKKWVEETIGKLIINDKPFDMTGTHICEYYGSETSFISIKYENLSVENIKKGQEGLGRTITTDARIPMEHFIAMQDDGLINSIYLIINPNLFVAIDRSSGEILIDNEKDIQFAAQVASRLKSGENVVKEVGTSPVTSATTLQTGTSQKALAVSYLKALSDKKIPEAIAMMTNKSVPDDATKQAWGVQFNAFKKLIVKSIVPAMESDWTDSKQSFLVTLDVEMTPESANGPIPYYGFELGSNDRWITLEKENGIWKVAGISTGP